MVLQPGELDLTGAKRLLMDVYLETPLSGGRMEKENGRKQYDKLV